MSEVFAYGDKHIVSNLQFPVLQTPFEKFAAKFRLLQLLLFKFLLDLASGFRCDHIVEPVGSGFLVFAAEDLHYTAGGEFLAYVDNLSIDLGSSAPQTQIGVDVKCEVKDSSIRFQSAKCSVGCENEDIIFNDV